MLDVDHFKRINDNFGHPAGDEVLRRVTAACRGMLRDEDLMGRLGGEEFAITLVQPPLPKAAAVAERLRKAVSELVTEHAGRQMTVTISLGIACLYTAKREGRNRVCAADDAPMQGSST
jgi:diguanylate cyclase (GGDEF)-like protein